MIDYSDYLRKILAGENDTVKTVDLGKLHLSSGKIVACDPLVNPDRQPFEKQMPQGDYLTRLYGIGTDYISIGLAAIFFSKKMPQSFEMATLPGQDVATLDEGYIFGYPVDAGIGCFMDYETAQLYQQHDRETEEKLGENFISYYDDVIDDVLQVNGGDWADFRPYPAKPHNVMLFASGYGDGFYPSYWGIDAQDEVVCLLTDFGVIPKED